MAPTRDPTMGDSQNTQLTLILGGGAQGGLQRVSRPRSDSLDIFTMSPLGTPPFDASSYARDGPSTPHLRLPDPPALDLDLGLTRTDCRAANVPHRPPSPPSTPNSPTSFSFSPPRRMSHQHHYVGAPFPPESQHGSLSGGTSYGTDLTSLIGSWDVKEAYGQDLETISATDVKGKAVQHETSSQLTGAEYASEPSPEKGKGKAVEATHAPPSPSYMPFEFDFDFHQTQDFDLGLKTTDAHGHEVIGEDDASIPPVVRLSPGSHYRQFGQSTEVYASPSSRNGHADVVPVENVEDVLLDPSATSNPDTPASSASPSRPISPPLLSPPLLSPPLPSAFPPFRLMNEVPTHPRLPTHRRSLSSLSLRSIRSSSSRSIASIRSTFSGVGIRGKVRSMAPAAKKLKGGLRKMFKRNHMGTSVDATGFTFSDDDDGSDDEDDNPGPRQRFGGAPPPLPPRAHQEQSISHQRAPTLNPSDQGHTLEASSDSQATVTHLAVSGAVRVPDNIVEGTIPTVPTKPRSMSEPLPFVRSTSEPSIEKGQDDSFKAACEQTSEVKQVEPEVVVTALPNRFNDKLPKELQLAVLRALVHIYEEEHGRAERNESQGEVWSVRTAAKTRWVGRDKGLRELVKLTRVSKTWQTLAFDGQLWDTLNLTSSPPHLSPALLLRLADHAGSFVRSLDLRGWSHLDPVTLRALVRSISCDPALDVLPSSPQTKLSTTMPPFPPMNLTHVSLRTCTSLTENSLHHVLLRAPGLRSVDLRGLSAVTNTTCGVLSGYCPRLEIADLGRCVNMDGDGLKELVGGGALARSWINEAVGPPITPSDTVALEYSTSKLRILRASGLKRLNEEVLTAIGKGAPDLEVLDLSGARDITDEAIEAFVMWDEAWDMPPSDTSCRRRIELTAREMGRDPTTDLGPFFKRITRLRHVNLSSCPFLTDAACTHLAHCVPQLEFLELAGIGQELKDDGLVRLLATTPLLRRLDLEDASDITDAVLEALTVSPPVEVRRRGVLVAPPPQPGHNLEHLVLSYALNVTNDALSALIHACKRLTVLECDNTRISGAVLKEFVKLVRQRQLRGAEIVTVDCRAVTEALVKDLAGSGQTRTRKGYRHYEARMLGYVDARDEENLGAMGVVSGMDVDDCDDRRVALKSFWSWQAVDAIQQAREKRRKLALSARRNTDAGVLGDAFRHSGILGDGDDEPFGIGGAGPSSRPRWLTQWARTSGSGSSSPTGMAYTNDEDRGCILM